VRHVLAVEDDSPIRAMLADLLDDVGYVVVQAGDGFEALRQLRRTRPDLIVLDLMLPGMSGWQFLERARSQLERANIPGADPLGHSGEGRLSAGRKLPGRKCAWTRMRSSISTWFSHWGASCSGTRSDGSDRSGRQCGTLLSARSSTLSRGVGLSKPHSDVGGRSVNRGELLRLICKGGRRRSS
jgi:Response regulator receiver domain